MVLKFSLIFETSTKRDKDDFTELFLGSSGAHITADSAVFVNYSSSVTTAYYIVSNFQNLLTRVYNTHGSKFAIVIYIV